MSRAYENFERSRLYPVPSDLLLVYFVRALYSTSLRGGSHAPAQTLFCIAIAERQ